MRHFTFKCARCGRVIVLRDRVAPRCCEEPMKRDWKADFPKGLYHPTRSDLPQD